MSQPGLGPGMCVRKFYADHQMNLLSEASQLSACRALIKSVPRSLSVNEASLSFLMFHITNIKPAVQSERSPTAQSHITTVHVIP